MKKSFIILMSAFLFNSCIPTEAKTGVSESSKPTSTLFQNIAYAEIDGESVFKFTTFLNNFEDRELSNLAMVSIDGIWIAIDNLNDEAKVIDLDVQIEGLKEGSINQHLQVFIPKGNKTLFIPEFCDKKECDYNDLSFILEGNNPIDGAVKSAVQLNLKFEGDQIVEQVATVK